MHHLIRIGIFTETTILNNKKKISMRAMLWYIMDYVYLRNSYNVYEKEIISKKQSFPFYTQLYLTT